MDKLLKFTKNAVIVVRRHSDKINGFTTSPREWMVEVYDGSQLLMSTWHKSMGSAQIEVTAFMKRIEASSMNSLPDNSFVEYIDPIEAEHRWANREDT